MKIHAASPTQAQQCGLKAAVLAGCWAIEHLIGAVTQTNYRDVVITAVAVVASLPMVAGGATVDGPTGAVEDETLAAFEWFCLAHINEPENIPKLFAAIGVEPVAPEPAAPFLGGHTGSVWFLPGESTILVIALTEMGACGVASPESLGEPARMLFEKHSRNRLLSEDTVGSETIYTYAVTQAPGGGANDIHAIVAIRTSNLASMKGINMNALPARLLRADGIQMPNWP